MNEPIPPLRSETMVLAAPLSYTGSAKRLWALTRGQQGGAKILTVTIALCLIAMAWTVVTCWYLVSIVLFGLITIPFRIIRRGQRRDKRNQQQHRELMEQLRQRNGS